MVRNILKKIGIWLFLGPTLEKSFKIDDILKIVIVNIIAILGTFYIMFFSTDTSLQEINSVFCSVVTCILVSIFIITFITLHTNKGIEYFKIVKIIFILNTMFFFGIVYAKITYGYIWSFLIPIMVILLTNIFLGLILCTCYFFLTLTVEFIFEIHNWELFGRYAYVHWSQVIIASVYESLRMKYNKRMQRNREKIEVLSITDHLTKLYNRRYFSISMKKEFARAIRKKESLSFLMIDADKFKNYNDTYGHLQGDELLISLAKIFKKIVKRSEDLVFRMGGEEFGVLLPNTDFNGAFSIAEKIREEVQNSTKATVSVGLACVSPEIGESSENLMKLADNNLYKAKEMGRNRVIG